MSRPEEVARALFGVAVGFAFVSAVVLLLLDLPVAALVVGLGGAIGFVVAARSSR